MTTAAENPVQLAPLAADEFARYAPFAWALTQDLTRCGYPVYTDGVKGEEDFLALARRSLQDQNADILLAKQGGEVIGWLQYYYLADDALVSLDACCIQRDTPRVLSAFWEYAARRFPGARMMLGFPGENTDAIGFLQDQGFEKLEELYNHMLLSAVPAPNEQPLPLCAPASEGQPLPPGVQRLTPQTFADFRRLHAPGETDMYWTTDRLLEHLDDWIILLYYDGEVPRGALWMIKAGPMWEIFGIDQPQGASDDACRALLEAAATFAKAVGARAVNFLCEKEQCGALRQAGFAYVCGYTCWQKRLPG